MTKADELGGSLSAMDELESFGQVVQVMAELHDCPFELDRARFSEASHEWSGVFVLPLWDAPGVKHRGVPFLYTRSVLPVAEAWLTIVGVVGATVVADQGIGCYSLNEAERMADGICLKFNERMRIELRVDGPVRGRYEERAAIGRRVVYHQLFLAQIGPLIQEVEET